LQKALYSDVRLHRRCALATMSEQI